MIKVQDLSKYYGNSKAIENISFEIGRGEIVGLLGLNGAGKSTILKILGCHLAPSHGSASLGGFSITDQADQVRKIIGFLPDVSPLYDEMTVKAYLKYVAKLKNVERSDVESYVRYAMEKTNLMDVSETHLGTLSHGFRQRVGIAQALVHKPKILILDEPINGLDPVQIVEMRDLIKSLKGEQTVILSSHILSEITKTCDRILVIDQGTLKAEGSADQLGRAMPKNLTVEVVVASVPTGVEEKIRGIAGVTGCKTEPAEAGRTLIKVDVASDLRPEIARVVVNSGADLLGLSRTDGGLESLFLKLIQNSK
jgi:ABC-2 type transport system ATP-binding protein